MISCKKYIKSPYESRVKIQLNKYFMLHLIFVNFQIWLGQNTRVYESNQFTKKVNKNIIYLHSFCLILRNLQWTYYTHTLKLKIFENHRNKSKSFRWNRPTHLFWNNVLVFQFELNHKLALKNRLVGGVYKRNRCSDVTKCRFQPAFILKHIKHIRDSKSSTNGGLERKQVSCTGYFPLS